MMRRACAPELAAIWIGIALASASCTADSGDAAPGTPTTVSSGPVPPPGSSATAAEQQLTKVNPPPGAVTGSGPMEEAVSNALAGSPAANGTMTFYYTCTGSSVVSIVVRDGDDPIKGASGSHPCGPAVFTRTFPVTKGSRISFRADTPTAAEGDYAYAYSGNVS